jgi:Helix-turn-helix domain
MRDVITNYIRCVAEARHVQEVTGNVAYSCRYYGVSREAFYRWRRRYEELGVASITTNQVRLNLCCGFQSKAMARGELPQSDRPWATRHFLTSGSPMFGRRIKWNMSPLVEREDNGATSA